MSDSPNVAVVRRYYDEVWNNGNLTVSDELVAEDETHHTHGVHGVGGPEWDKSAARRFRSTFPDVRFELEVVVDGGDLVAVRWSAHGHQARTGRALRDYTGVNIFRLESGRIVEVWNVRDDLGLFQQMGLVPPAEELAREIFSAV